MEQKTTGEDSLNQQKFLIITYDARAIDHAHSWVLHTQNCPCATTVELGMWISHAQGF